MFNWIRYIFSYSLSFFFIAFGFVKRSRKNAFKKKLITSIYFHDPSRALFEQCVQWLFKNHYTFISVNDLEDILEKKKPIPEQAVLITLDDAYKNNITNVVSIAEKYKVPVTIFAPTDSIETGIYWSTLAYKWMQYADPGFK